MKTSLQLLEEEVNSAYDYLLKVYTAYVNGEDDDFYEENDLEDLSNYITNSYDLEYTKTLQGDFRGCRLAIAFGDPNIYIDTQENRLEGYWGGTKFYKDFDSCDVCNEIDYIAKEFVNSF